MELAVGTLDRRAEALGDFAVLPDEILCLVLGLLEPRQAGIMACVSSVFYILCNEEPLWMQLCLTNQEGPLVYKDSWKRTTLEKTTKIDNLNLPAKALHFNGFSSLYLYRRWYRCNMTLQSFFLDTGAVERRRNLSSEDFITHYDGHKPVILTDLTEDWPARHTWTMSQLVHQYGDTQFKVSQAHGKRIRMKLRDYAQYMAVQHDEEPLYIFDSSFGEAAPGLLDDYKVPELFEEDLLSVLDPSQRPPFRWLVIGPARSGASWHVDPALTSAWNTLLCGKKRWALYPPGRVPPGVVVNVDEEDGDIDYDGPTSLQWWLDIYPSLEDDCKPLECTQLPGETIFVPSGWWHCVLNVDDTVAVTQNFVNSRNLELVCIDMAPGFHHRGVARAGALALQKEPTEIEFGNNSDELMKPESLKRYIEEHPDHFFSETNKDGYLNRRDLRDWLRKLQIARPDLKHQIWKCACISIDASTWLERLASICKAHNFPVPEGQEIPLGNGSSPVYLLEEYAIKLYVHEDGTAAALEEFGSELQFFNVLQQSGSSLRDCVPTVIASGILYHEDELYRAVPSVVNDEVARLIPTGRSKFSLEERGPLWPYVATKRCDGENVAHCRGMMTEADYRDLAAFLGRQLRELHSLPLPSVSNDEEGSKDERVTSGNNGGEKWSCQVPKQWEGFVSLIRDHRQTLMKRLKEWGSVPRHLLDKVEDYIPEDPVVLIGISKVENGFAIPSRSPTWLHMDVMDDNIQMIPYSGDGESCVGENQKRVMQARYILDFGDVLLGDPLYELVPLYTDVLEVNTELLKRFLESYELPLAVDPAMNNLRTSYRAMCYCLLYKYDALDIIFRLLKELRSVESWEDLEHIVWGVLNNSNRFTESN